MSRAHGLWVGVAAASLVALAALVLLIAAGPLTTNDLWWHLVRGRVYASGELWPQSDPCLHTAEHGPVPHQWLFGVAVYGVEQALGLHGLRALHGLAVAGILALVLALFRRESGAWAAACLATCVFLVLSWYRLVQLRPELVSIVAVLVLHRLLLLPPLPSWSRVGAAVVLIAVWANAHTLFMLGPLLLVAALLGIGLHQLGIRWSARRGAQVDAAGDGPRAARLLAALLLGLLAALANPRGVAQHLAFVVSSRAGVIWRVPDEWARFDPLFRSNVEPAVSVVSWVVADLLLLALVLSVGVLGFRFLRRPDRERLAALDPVNLGLAAAGAVAMVASIRFFWLSIFPLLFLLRAGHRVWTPRPGLRAGLDAACACGALALAIAFPLWGGFAAAAGLLPREPRRYLEEAYTGHRFFEEGVRFLEETGVEGRLFNPYSMGGFLCYRLAPRLQTFTDGSMNHPAEVPRDYGNVNAQRGSWPHETYLDVLDRYGVDVFFGVGVPTGGIRGQEDELYTTTLLERAPEWVLVSRSMRDAIYLRRSERNRENLERIARWYEDQGVPFDPKRGLDVSAVIREHPEFAVEQGLLPRHYGNLLAAARSEDPRRRAQALDLLGLAYVLAGAYEDALANDREASSLDPEAKAPLRRQIYALLRLDRPYEAATVAQRLVARDAADPRSRVFAVITQRYWRRSRNEPGALQQAMPMPADADLNALPLLTSRSPLRQ